MTTLLFQGHGSYRIAADDGAVIFVDPFVGEGYDTGADIIIVTHEHADHNHVDKMPHKDGCEILRAADFHPASDNYRTIESHGIKMTAVQACNANHPIDKCVGVVLELNGLKIYASGDTSTTDDMRSGKLAAMKIDYAFFPTDGYYNMDNEEASNCAALVAAKHSIPIHNVPVHDPNAPFELLDMEKAAGFQAEGRILLKPGEMLEM